MLGTAGALLLGGVLLLQTKTFAAPGDGPVVQYSFEDASNLGKDSSSAGNNATNNRVTQTLGRVGKAAHFNGSNAALDLSAHASKLNLTEGTVSFWAKADADAPDFSSILAWGTSSPDGSTYDWGYIWLGNETYWYPDELLSFANASRGVGDPYRAFDEVTRPDTFYKDGKWHSYTVTMDSAKKLWLYIDGEPQTNYKNGQSLTPFFLSHNNNKISIWYHHLYSAGGKFFKWAIDEFKIYNYARTAAQIKADYEQEANPVSLEAKLVAQYSFEDANNLWKDSSSVANHATNNGVTQTLGRVGKAGYFDGSSKLRVEYNPSLSWETVTASFWVKPNFPAGEAFRAIIGKHADNYYTAPDQGKVRDFNFYLYQDWSNNINRMHMSSGRIGSNRFGFSPKMNNSEWYHVAVTSDKTNVKTYLNWNLVDTNPIPAGISGATDRYALQIGMADNAFVGVIDELKIYNYARTAEQIKADYEQEAKPALIIHYEDENGEQLIPPTMHTTNPWGSTFQLNQTYIVNPAKLNEPSLKARFDTPDSQNVTFTDADRVKEVTFVYKRPRLVLHYTFDEGGTTVADSSQLETKNPGTVIGTPTRSERGRVGGMYTDTAIQTQRRIWIGDSAAFTVAGWVKTDNKTHQNYFITNAWGADGFRFWMSNWTVSFLIGNNEHSNPAIRAWYQETSCGTRGDLANGEWHHLVWVFDVTGKKVTCYVDGVKDWERVLPRVYRQRNDRRATIGGKNQWAGTLRQRWSIDDVRVYNYALSPQKVKELYDSFPAEENTITKVEITSNIQGAIYTSQRFQLNVKAFLGRRGKNLTLEVRLPWKMEEIEYAFAPVNGENIVSGAITKTVVGTGILITIPLKDTVAGDIQWVIKGKYANAVTPHLYDGTSTVTLYKNQKVLNTAKVVQTVWTKPSVLLLKERTTKVWNGYDITYAFKTTINYLRADGSVVFSHYDPAALFNAVIEIPLPTKAKFIRSENPNLTYDSSRRMLLIKHPFFHNHHYHEHRVILQYSGLTVWEQINFGQATLRGNVASADGELYIQNYPMAPESMEAEHSVFNVRIGQMQGHFDAGNRRSAGLINNQKWQDLFDISMSNDGNTTIRNASFSVEIPEWIQPYEFTLPWRVGHSHEWGTNYIKPIKFDYTTNKWVQKTVMGVPWSVYNRANLGLANDEYLTKMMFYFPEVKPWEKIVGSNYYWIPAIRVRGDVKQVSGNPVLKWIIKREGALDIVKDYTLQMNEKGYIPIYSIATTNRDTATQGDIVHMNVSIEPAWAFYYGNSRYLENPSEFILLPPGFQLDEQSFRGVFTRGSWQISKPRKVTNARNVPAGWTVRRIDNTVKISWENTIIKYDFDIKLSDSVLPGTYDLEQNVFIGSDNPKYQVHWAWGEQAIDDPYGLWGTTTVNKIGRYVHQRKVLTVTALNYGNAICHNSQLETSLHSACRESYKWDAIQYVSNYKSGNEGHYTTTLYNQWSPINNFVYTIEIPAAWELTSDGKRNDWRPTINSTNGVVVSNVPAGTKVLYWYAENALSETFLPNAKFVQVRIPTLDTNQRPEIKINRSAPNFDDTSSLVYARAFISSYYTINGTKVPSRVIALRLVPSDYNPADDEKYALCRSQRRKNVYPAVSVRECEALVDLYKDTWGTNWREKTHWVEAVQFKPENDYSENAMNVCNWRGISCNSQWRLVGIDLENNNLINKFSNSFKNLNNLEVLNLSENLNFNAEFKSEFKTSLTNLKKVNLSYTNTKNLNNLPASLEKLDAQKLTLTEFPFTDLANLKEIDLSHGLLSGVSNIKPLFDRPKLEKLIVQNAKLRGSIPAPASLPATATIKEINLKNNQLTGKLPPWVKKLTSQPVKIDFAQNYITGPFPDWDANFKPETQIEFKNNYIDTLFSEGNYKRFKKKFRNLDSSYAQFKLVATNWGNKPLPEIRDMKSDAKVHIAVQKQELTSVDGGPVRSFNDVNDGVELIAVQQPGSHVNVQKRHQVRFDVALTHGFVSTLNIQTELWNEPMLSVKLIPAKDFQDENDPNKLQDPNNPDSKVLTGKTMFGTGLTFELKGKYLAQYFSAVHYSLWGNDIGGGFFWREVEDLETPVTISANGTGNVECYGRVKGFYYSSQRGERLWPLDGESQEQLKQLNPTYAHLAMQWGRYTRCQGNENNIYGKITHTYKDKSYDLIAGVSYNVAENKVTTPPALRCNFQRLNNAIPFGYIYDSAGGIGILGASIKSNVMKRATDWDADAYRDIHLFHKGYLGQLENWKCVSDIFDHDGQNPRYNDGSIPDYNSDKLDRLLDFGFGSAQTTLFKLGIRGIIWLSSELSNNSRGSIEGNQAGTSLLLNTDNSIAGVINLARQRAEELCRNKWERVPGTEEDLGNRAGQVLCYDGNKDRNSRILRVNRYDEVAALIVKNADVFLLNYQVTRNNAAITNLFIDKGYLFLLDEARNKFDLQKFDQNGYQTQDASNPWISYGNFLRGNFIVNGLIIGMKPDTGQFTPIKNKLVIHGKVASYNTYTTPDDNKKQVIKDILGSDGGRVEEGTLKFIGLDQVFKWSCNSATGTGSDGTPCIGTDKGSSFITNKAFSLIDMDLSSPLFQ